MRYRELENLILKGLQQQECAEDLTKVTEFYKEFDQSHLAVQLQMLATHFKDKKVSLQDCIVYLRSLSPAAGSCFSEVESVVRLILVLPAMNAVGERSFSTMRRVKAYLCSIMRQDRLNHAMVLAIYKEALDKLPITAVANEFVSKSEHRKRFFGQFK